MHGSILHILVELSFTIIQCSSDILARGGGGQCSLSIGIVRVGGVCAAMYFFQIPRVKCPMNETLSSLYRIVSSWQSCVVNTPKPIAT